MFGLLPKKFHDLARLLCAIVLGLLIGIFNGHIKESVMLVLVLFIIWQYFVFSKIYHWLQDQQKLPQPSQSGLVESISREIHHLDKKSRTVNKLFSYLKRFYQGNRAIPDAVIVLNLYNEIIWANQKATEYLGIHLPQDYELRLVNLVRDAKLSTYLLDESRWKKGLNLESPINRQQQLEIRLAISPEDQKILIARDITDHARIEQLHQDFIANASHELRTPLTVISGYLDSLRDDQQCPHSWIEAISQMQQQATRMQNLINELLQLSSLDKQTSVAQEYISGSQILSELVDLFTSKSPQTHRLITNISKDIHLRGNREQLYSIFSNLLINAYQHTPSGTEIQIHWYQDNNGAHFKISDNGTGIHERHILRLTERFYRINTDHRHQGTGLGLAIVKQIIEKYEGGRLHIESTIGTGSTFKIDFPTRYISDT